MLSIHSTEDTQRLKLINKYMFFFCIGVNNRGHRSQKVIQVRNDRFDDFQPPRMSLLKFVLSLNCCKTH